MQAKNQWASRLGFIMATAGAAIGLGNLWKFPYLMGRNGGFPFLIAYLFFIVILGLPVMMTEMSLGRKTRHDPVQAYADIDPHAKIVGIFGVMAAFVILSYYSVIGGWIIKYIISYGTTLAAPADFTMFISSNEPVIWHFVFMAITTAICFFGISGIEKASKFMMPLLFVLLIVIIVRSVTLPGASEGLRFIFHRRVPDSAWVLSVQLWDRYFIRSACAWGLQLPTAAISAKRRIYRRAVFQSQDLIRRLPFWPELLFFRRYFRSSLNRSRGRG